MVWGQSPSAGQVMASKNSRPNGRYTAGAGWIAPHTSSSTETDVATSLTSRAGDDGGSVGGGLRVLDALVGLSGAHGEV